MTNTVFTFNTFQRDNRTVRDYTSFYFNEFENFLNAYNDYFEIVEVSENEKIEKLSYDLYGNENYADLILAINNENFLWSCPYDQDVIMNITDSVLHEFASELNLESFNESDSYKDFENKIKDNIEELNSKKKYFKIPKKDKLTDVLSLVNQYKTMYAG